MKKSIILISAVIFLASCASSSGSKTTLRNPDVSKGAKLALADKNSEERVICKQMRKTGSNRITTVCRSQSEIKATREAAQREMRNSINRTNHPKGESGGL